MTAPSLTYTLTNGSTADATQVMQNFNDLLNGITDASKDLSISALTCAGAASLNAAVTLGASSANDLIINASVASHVVPKTSSGTYNLGSAAFGWLSLYLAASGDGDTAQIVAASHGADRVYTVPDCGAAASFVMTELAQSINAAKTFTVGQIIDGTVDEIQLRIQGHSTQTSAVDIFVVEKSDGTDLLGVTNTSGSRIRGTTTNDSAATGFVGEQLGPITRLRSNATSLTTATAANVGTTTSITLTAGDWDVRGVVGFQPGASTTVTQMVAAISATSATLPAADTIAVPTSGETWAVAGFNALVLGNIDYTLTIPTFRVTVANAATLPLFLVARSSFAISTMVAYGWMEARRVR